MAANYSDEYHRKLRERVARHRERNKVKIAQRESAKRTAAGRQQPGRKALWTLWERINVSGEPYDVELVPVDGAPSPDAVRSQWLPSMAMTRAMALKLRRVRLDQIYPDRRAGI